MSMRTCPILDKGFIITNDNAIEFLRSYKGGNADIDGNEDYLNLIKDSIESDSISDFELFTEMLENMAFIDLGDLTGFFTQLFDNITDKGLIRRNEDIYFDEDIVYIYYI